MRSCIETYAAAAIYSIRLNNAAHDGGHVPEPFMVISQVTEELVDVPPVAGSKRRPLAVGAHGQRIADPIERRSIPLHIIHISSNTVPLIMVRGSARMIDLGA